MTNSCEKCGSEDLHTQFIKNNECCETSSTTAVDNEFIYSIEYSYFYKLKALKEHLYKHCRNCQYNWREQVLQAKEQDDD